MSFAIDFGNDIVVRQEPNDEADDVHVTDPVNISDAVSSIPAQSPTVVA